MQRLMDENEQLQIENHALKSVSSSTATDLMNNILAIE